MKKTLCALVVLSTTSLPVMAEKVDITVSGSITPVACKMNLPASGVLDYGTISPSVLHATDYTVLEEMQLNLVISCPALVKAGVKAINGREGTMAGTTEGSSNAGRVPAAIFGSTSTDGVGLGQEGDTKIGGYGIRLVPGTLIADSMPVEPISKGSGDATWVQNSTGSLYDSTKTRETTWATTGSVTPVEFRTMSATIGIQAYINKQADLDFTKDLKLNGQTTLELVYL